MGILGSREFGAQLDYTTVATPGQLSNRDVTDM
jgi:hypothetical protein